MVKGVGLAGYPAICGTRGNGLSEAKPIIGRAKFCERYNYWAARSGFAPCAGNGPQTPGKVLMC
jgi:hypothetical protein